MTRHTGPQPESGDPAQPIAMGDRKLAADMERLFKNPDQAAIALFMVCLASTWKAKAKSGPRVASPPRLGQLLICLFVPVDRHAERLGDFEEKFNTLWLPRFGPRAARLIFMTHAIRSAAAIMRIMAVAALADRVIRVFGR